MFYKNEATQDIRFSETGAGFSLWRPLTDSAEDLAEINNYKASLAPSISQDAVKKVSDLVEKLRKEGVCIEHASWMEGDAPNSITVRKVMCSANGNPQRDGTTLYSLDESVFNDRIRKWNLHEEDRPTLVFVFPNQADFKPMMEKLVSYTTALLEDIAPQVIAHVKTLAVVDPAAVYDLDIEQYMRGLVDAQNLQEIPTGWHLLEGSRVLEED